MQRGFTPILILVGILLIAVIGGTYYLGTKKPATLTPTTPVITSPPQPSSTSSPNADSSTPLPTLNLTADMFQIQGGNWSVYSDTRYNYHIDYPAGWTAKDGAFIPPGGKPNYNGIYITKQQKVSDHITDDLTTYAKNGAGFETSPIRTPIALSKITTQTGIIGYIVEWKASPWSKNLKTYTTYFALPNDTTSVLEIQGIENDHMDVYYQMLPTFKFTQ